MNFNKHFLFPAGFLAILCFAGVAWAQGGNLDRQGEETQFLPPVSTESPYLSSKESPYQSLNSAKGLARPKATEINKKLAVKAKNVNKGPMSGGRKTDSTHPPFGQYGSSKVQSPSQITGATESAPIGKSLGLSAGSTSKSFLDGYFLKSLHEERVGRKRSRDEAESEDNFQPKSQKRNVRDSTLK